MYSTTSSPDATRLRATEMCSTVDWLLASARFFSFSVE
jgi:hypothetical protein